jgi:predicted TPR repeat methyltransferase
MQLPLKKIKDPIRTNLDNASAAIARGDLKVAAILLNEAEARSPGDARTYWMGAKLAVASNNHKGAIGLLRKAKDVAPNWAPLHRDIAFSLLALGYRREAALAYERAFELDPRDVYAGARAAAIHYEVLNHAGTERVARKLLEKPHSTDQDEQLLATLCQAIRMQDRIEEANEFAERCLKVNPDNTIALTVHASHLMASNENERAEGLFVRILDINPDHEVAKQSLAVLRGSVADGVVTESFTRSLFNSYAKNFDAHLVDVLGYSAPKQVADKLREMYDEKPFNLLDLGCGTGLLGEALLGTTGWRIGVDLSPAMLEEAEKKSVYHRLHEASVEAVLRDTPENLYDVVTALDMLNYIGPLESFFSGCKRVLKSSGHLIFTLETATDTDESLVLDHTFRYKHSRAYVQNAINDAQLELVAMRDEVLRYEKGAPVMAMYVIVRNRRATTESQSE